MMTRMGSKPVSEEQRITNYAGATWVEQHMNKATSMSPFGRVVADIMGDLYYGIYHWDGWKRTDWSKERYIRVIVSGDLSTFDFDGLTRLVLLAHALCVRVSVSPCNMQYLEIMFHPRTREGYAYQRHPTMEEAVNEFAARHTFMVTA